LYAVLFFRAIRLVMQSMRRSGITGHLSNSVIYDIKIAEKIEDYSCIMDLSLEGFTSVRILPCKYITRWNISRKI